MSNVKQKSTSVHAYQPVGECIYCGEEHGLSDEHVIPLALHGTLVLPAASCEECAKLTSALERKVLRGFMYDARVVGDFPSRRKKLRPKTIRTKLLDQNNEAFEENLPVSEAAALLTLPTLARASILANEPPSIGAKLLEWKQFILAET